jgi:hypothetical protein
MDSYSVATSVTAAIYLEVTPNFDDVDLSGIATKHSHRAQRHRTTALLCDTNQKGRDS